MADLDVASLKGLTQDSRKVRPGYLFAAIPGMAVDGRDFIDSAIEAGATHVLVPTGTAVSNDHVEVIF